MDGKQIKRITYRKLGKLVTSYEGLRKAAQALKRRYGRSQNFLNREYLIETHIATYYTKNGKKLRTIGRSL